jgi:hypothetical protein
MIHEVTLYYTDKKIQLCTIESSYYIKQPHFREEWQPATSVTGKTASEKYKLAIIVNEQFIDFI